MNDEKTLKKWFEISEDELCARMLKQTEEHDAPIQQAVAVLEAALDTVLKKLGVDVERDDIPFQMENLGIIIKEETREELAGINGFYIFIQKKNDLIPYGWVGAAHLTNEGKCRCEIHLFQDERMEEIIGPKIIH